MNNGTPEEQFFEQIAERAPQPSESASAPSKLKSRMYSALMRRQAASGPLASFTQAKASGHRLCCF